MALHQLLINKVDYSISIHLIGNTVTPDCYNTRDSIMYWFITHEDGFPRKEDIHEDYASIIPQHIYPSNYKDYDITFQPSLNRMIIIE